jgi:hypothetical protein
MLHVEYTILFIPETAYNTGQLETMKCQWQNPHISSRAESWIAGRKLVWSGAQIVTIRRRHPDSQAETANNLDD